MTQTLRKHPAFRVGRRLPPGRCSPTLRASRRLLLCYDSVAMKHCWLVLFLAGLLPAAAQHTNTITFDELLQSAQDWARENLDTNALQALASGDPARQKQAVEDMQRQFQGEYVIDLAQLRGAANALLPLLEANEETRPYAAWLKTRLDCLDAADEIRLLVPPPKPEPGKPPPIPVPQPDLVREVWIRKVATRPVPEESKPYVGRLKPIFAAQDVPSELVWIAETESSFDPRAESPVGAAGMFQLMPATAKRYGLKTWPFDQRYNPEDSARASAKYLSYLHGHFKDWRLAIAAYNAGEGTVQKLLDRQKARTYDAIACHLPAETQMFVPKVEATLLRREGVRLEELP